MNIREAKEEIRRTIEIYLMKNEYGEYEIPYMKQRPIYMVGAPGIGKTAIMEQITSELGLAIVSYSMSHHTRQSAIGLPYITEKKYGTIECRISEYTMSEIVAEVYETIENSGIKEGILFLDEINCVSETLAPAMLLFLQYKKFGNWQIPEGWVIVTAGNPPEYNKSVKEFDIATSDRLKCIYIEEDLRVWKSYAYERGIHPAIISFLETKPEWFYSVSQTVDGQKYVTARGWEDLSLALKAYEKKKFPVNSSLIAQYITDSDIVRKFSAYYDLFIKYRSSYSVKEILNGIYTEEITKKAEAARFDERLSLLGMLLDELNAEFAALMQEDEILSYVVKSLRAGKKHSLSKGQFLQFLESEINKIQTQMDKKKKAGNLSNIEKHCMQQEIELFRSYIKVYCESPLDKENEKFELVKKAFKNSAKKHEKALNVCEAKLNAAFAFIELVWKSGNELVMFMTELTANRYSMEFIELCGCEEYFKRNKKLLIYDEQSELKNRVKRLLELE